MDSSSIVCIADRILAEDPALTPRLDTLSYFDDTEPDWNERPFITEVETALGRSGLHIDVSMQQTFLPERNPESFPSTPAAGVLPSVPQQEVSPYLSKEVIRVEEASSSRKFHGSRRNSSAGTEQPRRAPLRG